ncbi:MAG TPA: phytoene/squalene synthase family protein [Chthoniobacterales bacterium]|nr:phytoene/squalene synthase family protein [Chthoniobacterales bacterium]
MNTPKDFDHLRGPILRAVSRSFYLSLRALPRALRDPLSLAYLLARATDTIADTPGVPAKVRTDALRNLVGAIQGTAESAEAVRDAFAPLQGDKAERALIDALPAALAWLDTLEERDRSEVRAVLEKINRGQTLDLERFSGAEMQALPTAADLDEYTYLVAGCVGEFWTRLCFSHVKNFSNRSEAEMRALGVQYGKGLQLINILRDAGADLRNGRCYLPASELQSSGLTPEEILRSPARSGPVLQPWLENAGRGLAAGIDYACAIRPRRIRFATALPALIGARTLALLRTAGPEVFERKIKVSRAEVRKIIIASALASPRSLRASFERLQGAAVSKPPSV